MNRTIKTAAIIAAAAGIVLGASGCSQSTPASSSSSSSSADPSQLTGAKAADTIRAFVASSTSDQVAADVSTKATVQNTVSDFVLVKMADPKAPVAVTVDDAKATVDGLTATVPVSAITVTSGGKKVANSDALAAEVSHLAYRDGAWVITFPTDGASRSAAPSTSPSK